MGKEQSGFRMSALHEDFLKDTHKSNRQIKPKTSTRQIGAEKEQLAVAYLQEQGYEIIACNFVCRQGEIDLIARKSPYLIFIEVKYRKSNRFGSAEEAVTMKKQMRIQKAAQYYLYKEKIPQNTPCRFDVVAINQEQIELIENAF